MGWVRDEGKEVPAHWGGGRGGGDVFQESPKEKGKGLTLFLMGKKKGERFSFPFFEGEKRGKQDFLLGQKKVKR